MSLKVTKLTIIVSLVLAFATQVSFAQIVPDNTSLCNLIEKRKTEITDLQKQTADTQAAIDVLNSELSKKIKTKNVMIYVGIPVVLLSAYATYYLWKNSESTSSAPAPAAGNVDPTGGAGVGAETIKDITSVVTSNPSVFTNVLKYLAPATVVGSVALIYIEAKNAAKIKDQLVDQEVLLNQLQDILTNKLESIEALKMKASC